MFKGRLEKTTHTINMYTADVSCISLLTVNVRLILQNHINYVKIKNAM